jgi:lysophospholipid acyltransferase (LPLAT)-like uncharacterized protein
MSEAETNQTSEDASGPRHIPTGGRRLTPARRLVYAIGAPLLSLLARLLWRSYRIETVVGADVVERVLADQRAYIPCYWHRDILVCLMLIRGWIRRGFKAGIIISPSVDGEVPSKIARSWGAEVIRGSAKRTGALAMRDMHQVMKRGVSIVTAADGPVGPAYYFKPGVILTSRIGNAPLLPIGCAASSAWTFKTWDDFTLPKPFARLVITVGEPVSVPPRASSETLDEMRVQLQDAVNSASERSKAVLTAESGNRA